MTAPTPEECAGLLRPLRSLVGLRTAVAHWPDQGPLPVAAGGLLAELVHRGECRVSELAHRRLTDVSVVSRQLSQLEAAGLVTRRPDPYDRRVCLVAANADGAAELRRLDRSKAEWLSHALRDWDAETLRTVVAVLSDMSDDLHRAAYDRAQEGTR
ncbi:MarR family transcriptional regulator [Allosaccharopolyspora coralli]|uniref:MarR family transcriptional regulator n=1 Tax=Allosaccharopolyspora coralli TaxID=2665642 RepID=A0A5Q3QEK4_9PSEU|nr:MarR family winged helix-turn-helix transcriptional regulator [Allosaccharopolyspora coralli]QGK71806.1 MarR family transcriptional regulator [Allosaccharopolyspora coralli]